MTHGYINLYKQNIFFHLRNVLPLFNLYLCVKASGTNVSALNAAMEAAHSFAMQKLGVERVSLTAAAPGPAGQLRTIKQGGGQPENF